MRTRQFQSKATSAGIAIGVAYNFKDHSVTFPKTWIRNQDIEEEIKRFKVSVQLAREQILHVQTKLCRYEGHDQINILDSQLMFLKDDMLVKKTLDHITSYKINAEWALHKTLEELSLSFANMNEDYFQERLHEIDFIGKRIMNNLVGRGESPFANLPDDTEIISISRDLSPAEIAAAPKDKIKGFITETGGPTSHTAIIARSLEIPALFGIKKITEKIKDGEPLILDGMKGILIASPSPRELSQYRDIQKKYEALEKVLMQEINLPAVTKDGFEIKLEANMEIIEEIPSVIQHGAEGIGLYRTENLFLGRYEEPSEEEQFKNYVAILESLKPKTVTIRTIDIGGDKLPYAEQYEGQTNPALGLRAIRLCLRDTALFKTQLRALLRASVHGHLKILIPMISHVEQIHEIKKIIKSVKEDLSDEKIPFKKDVKIGAMIEVPAAAITAEFIASEVDFLSIGTNDLIQYSLAIDRTNELVSDLFTPLHPAILRMIKSAVDAAKLANIPIAICGEMAGDPRFIQLFIALGLTSLSMNPISIPRVKKTLRELKKSESEKLLEKVLQLKTSKEIDLLIKKETEKYR